MYPEELAPVVVGLHVCHLQGRAQGGASSKGPLLALTLFVRDLSLLLTPSARPTHSMEGSLPSSVYGFRVNLF